VGQFGVRKHAARKRRRLFDQYESVNYLFGVSADSLENVVLLKIVQKYENLPRACEMLALEFHT